jgi:hypothetical protein
MAEPTNSKRVFSGLDTAPATLYAKQDPASEFSFPILVNSSGTLVVQEQNVSVALTSSSIVVGNTSTLVLASRPLRENMILVNDSTQNIYLAYGTTALMNKGIRLNSAGGSLTDDTYTGQVSAICSSGGMVVTVTEL